MILITKQISNGLLALAFFCAGVGMSLEFHRDRSPSGPSSEPGWVIDSPDDLPAKSAISVIIPLRNISNRKIVVLGSTQVCNRQCCAVTEGPSFEIPAGKNQLFRVRLRTGEAGDFQCPITLFTDQDGCGQMTLRLKGHVSSSVGPSRPLPAVWGVRRILPSR